MNNKLRKALFIFFKKYKYPSDDLVHKLADKLGVDKHDIEEEIYAILTDFFAYGRYSEDPNIEIDPHELKMGMNVEMEHTNCMGIAKKIALDHLAEMPDYYTKLAKMEGEE